MTPRDDLEPKARASEPEESGKAGNPTVVAIGASAGGLSALKRFFALVPSDTGLAFVVVVHLAPDHESHLADVLRPHVSMPVEQVNESVPIVANRVYVIPPNANLNSIDTHLRLSNLEDERLARAPVDHFFRTLAKSHDGQSVGIVLTGSGRDGALGIKAIKEQGGLTVVQAPDDAEYTGMPRSAIATGAVDLVLPLEEIPAAVIEIVQTSPRVSLVEDGSDLPAESGQFLHTLFALLRARARRDFSRYKRSTVLRRIARRMQIHRIHEMSAYLDLLREQQDEVTALADDLLITVTNFFRDADVFDRLTEDVIPGLFEQAGAEGEIRVWSAGCATGEEAYSLAILLLEEASRHAAPPRLQVFATDLHEPALKRAREGLYSGDIEMDVSADRLKRFFEREEFGYRIRASVRDIVLIAPHNLLGDAPFSRLDLISCRNLLIYLQRNVQRDVIELFHYALKPDGILLVGSSENVERSELFVTEDKKAGVFKRRDVQTPEPRLPVFPLAGSGPPEAETTRDVRTERVAYGALHSRIVERYAPPSLLVGPDDAVVHLSERAGQYLLHPGGELTAGVSKLVRQELRAELRAALFEARRGHSTRSRPILIRERGTTRSVILDVRATSDEGEEGFALVIFDERFGGGDDPDSMPSPATQPSSRQHELENELSRVNLQLQTVIEEYETGQQEMRAANEELQSANEELRSTLEELETSKEELHSMNEELQTVNQENHHKVEELAQLTGDLQNFLGATDIATLFLDRAMRIMRFTPRLRGLINVRAEDRGRYLSDLTHRLNYPELNDDALSVLDRLIPVDREVQDHEGRWYLTRILPYRSGQDRIDGVVFTFVDITARKQAEHDLSKSEENLSAELQSMIRLHELVSRLLVCPGLEEALEEVLKSSIALTNADMGHIHLVDPEGGVLKMTAQHGSAAAYAERFATVPKGDASATARAFASGEQIVIVDVEEDEAYAPFREVARAAGYRGVQSTPLIGRDASILGVLTTHYADPVVLPDRSRRVLELYASQAAAFIERVRTSDSLREKTVVLEAEDERKGFFLATLGHELRNPLGALGSAMGAIQAGAGDLSKLHSIILAQINHLSRLVDDLLEVSRVTRGKIDVQKSRIDLVPVIRAAVQTLEVSTGRPSQNLSLELPDACYIEGDGTRLAQIVANLLSNASKFNRPDGRIELSLRRQDEFAVLEVRDEGRGMNREDLSRIFEPFVQVEPGTGGLGIGLALVEHLVKLHGGTVEARSAGRELGSVFCVRIPIRAVGEGVGAIEEPSALIALPNPFDSIRILVVEDMPEAAEALSMLLTTRGADVRYVQTGADAIATFRDWRPPVVLLDIGLPDMTGYEVAQAIRAVETENRALVIAVTGFGDAATAEKARAVGFDEILVKPINQQKLGESIQRHFESVIT